MGRIPPAAGTCAQHKGTQSNDKEEKKGADNGSGHQLPGSSPFNSFSSDVHHCPQLDQLREPGQLKPLWSGAFMNH